MEIRDRANAVLAATDETGLVHCVLCGAWLQRTATGDIRDGVRVHYRTVHPERKIR